MAGLVVAALVVITGRATLGSGRGVIEDLLFVNQAPAGAGLVLGRLAGACLWSAAGGAGGIFAPALASGAALASARLAGISFQVGLEARRPVSPPVSTASGMFGQ